MIALWIALAALLGAAIYALIVTFVIKKAIKHAPDVARGTKDLAEKIEKAVSE